MQSFKEMERQAKNARNIAILLTISALCQVIALVCGFMGDYLEKHEAEVRQDERAKIQEEIQTDTFTWEELEREIE